MPGGRIRQLEESLSPGKYTQVHSILKQMQQQITYVGQTIQVNTLTPTPDGVM